MSDKHTVVATSSTGNVIRINAQGKIIDPPYSGIWIRVADRLPEPGAGSVLIWAEGYGHADFGWMDDELWSYDHPKPTHWMPLPEPPDD